MMTLGEKVKGRKVKLHDMCLRDGMHSMRHQITLEQMIEIASGLDEAGVPLIQVTHGDGLGDRLSTTVEAFIPIASISWRWPSM